MTATSDDRDEDDETINASLGRKSRALLANTTTPAWQRPCGRQKEEKKRCFIFYRAGASHASAALFHDGDGLA